jgi:hypothetical protein
MSEENKLESESKNKQTRNTTIADAIIYVSVVIPWIFGIALSKESIISLIFAFLFPPYSWMIFAEWVISIINKSFNM